MPGLSAPRVLRVALAGGWKGLSSVGRSRALLAPSILAADFAQLARECETVAAAGADWVHVDVMDGHFVPNLTMGAPVVRSLRRATELPLDVHLMIEEPGRFLGDFIAAGADSITFHIEAVAEPRPLLREIRGAGRKAGLALRPQTPPDRVAEVLSLLDLVVVMTVEPGFGGQRLLPEPLAKIRRLEELAGPGQGAPQIEVDGGVDLDNLSRVLESGATVVVAGSAIFRAGDAAAAVRRFREVIDARG